MPLANKQIAWVEKIRSDYGEVKTVTRRQLLDTWKKHGGAAGGLPWCNWLVTDNNLKVGSGVFTVPSLDYTPSTSQSVPVSRKTTKPVVSNNVLCDESDLTPREMKRKVKQDAKQFKKDQKQYKKDMRQYKRDLRAWKKAEKAFKKLATLARKKGEPEPFFNTPLPKCPIEPKSPGEVYNEYTTQTAPSLEEISIIKEKLESSANTESEAIAREVKQDTLDGNHAKGKPVATLKINNIREWQKMLFCVNKAVQDARYSGGTYSAALKDKHGDYVMLEFSFPHEDCGR